MIYDKFAVVVDNVDPLKKGRVKLRPMPEFNGVEDSLLNWSYPHVLNGGGVTGGGEHNVPEIGEMVKIVIRDKFWQRIEYVTGDYTEDAYPYEDFSKKVSSMSELDSQTYPQPKYIKQYKDGSYYFHNSETGESGHFHNSGSYVIFDKDGNTYTYSKKDIKSYNDNASLEIKENGDTSIDTSGAISLTDSGSISLNGNAKSLVTYAELNLALNTTFWTQLKLALSTGLAGPYPVVFSALPSLNMDLSASETTKAKVGA